MAKTMHERWYLGGFDASGNINRVVSTAGGLREVQDLRIGNLTILSPRPPPTSSPLTALGGTLKGSASGVLSSG